MLEVCLIKKRFDNKDFIIGVYKMHADI